MAKTTELFIHEATKIHGNIYDYSLVEYYSRTKKVKIICSTHGEFTQRPYVHLQGGECLKCSYINRALNRRAEHADFIAEALRIHGEKFDYSKTNYTTKKSKITIICPIHGEFEQVADQHLRSTGCPKCGIALRAKANESNLTEFIHKAKLIHEHKYDYSLTDYISSKQKVTISCPIHGEFSQRPNDHLSGKGCPTCGKESSLEGTVAQILDKYSILYERGKTFDTLIFKSKQFCDFYLPELDTIIEANGIQHYVPRTFHKSGNKHDDFKYQIERDDNKRNWAYDNGFTFIEIPFTMDTEERIEQHLKYRGII